MTKHHQKLIQLRTSHDYPGKLVPDTLKNQSLSVTKVRLVSSY